MRCANDTRDRLLFVTGPAKRMHLFVDGCFLECGQDWPRCEFVANNDLYFFFWKISFLKETAGVW